MNDLPASPYQGLRPFQSGEGLFGRDEELEHLRALVLTRQTVVVYATSGAGKTSLINAGLIPELTREGMEVLPIARFGLVPLPPYAANAFVLDALRCWAQPDDLEKLKRLRIAEFLGEIPRDSGKPLVLIFDQFEDFFTAHWERWRDRAGFFGELGQALDQDRSLRAVFSMREDYIAQLDPYIKFIPDRTRGRFRLERLREWAARDAVMLPAQQSGCTFEAGAVERLIDQLRTVRVRSPTGELLEVQEEFVEPTQLQIICHSFWQALPPGISIIRSEHIAQFNADAAMARFFDDCMRRAAAEGSIDEGVLRRALAKAFLTPAGTRASVYADAHESGGIPNQVLALLETMRLVRSEFRSGARWYELIHDRLLPVVQASGRQQEGAHGAG